MIHRFLKKQNRYNIPLNQVFKLGPIPLTNLTKFLPILTMFRIELFFRNSV